MFRENNKFQNPQKNEQIVKFPVQGSKQRKSLREGFSGGERLFEGVFLEILPLQKSKEKPIKPKKKTRET